jgi:hypothetical protein
MATFIKIKPQESNLSGIASKGYNIYRRGNKVFIKWGAIKSQSRKFYWAGPNLPQSKVAEFKTLKETLAFYKDKIRRINNQEYNKLPIGKKILKYKVI